jgi:hypothetical protein
MEIRERIESCLKDLDLRRRKMAEFEIRVRALMKALDRDGTKPGTMDEALTLFSTVLKNYAEIDVSCRHMIEGLREVETHMDKIDDGRKKIMDGVEKILGHLTQLDTLARQTLDGSQGTPPTDEKKDRPKRVLLIRLHPQPAKEKRSSSVEIEHDEDDLLEGGLDLGDGQDTTVH